jgi:hypothetical protein
MATDRVTIEQFVERNRISLTAEMVDRNPHMDGSDNMDNYKCVLIRRESAGKRYNARKDGTSVAARMTVHFSKGIGHHGAEPEADEVLSCLASDAAGVENARGDFAEWCSEYGYNTDSRKAEKIFKVCEHQAARLKNLLGDDLYDQLLWHTEAL